MSVVINGSEGVTTNSGAVYNGISAGTAVASTSGTSIDFTSIPSWVKRITVMFNGVSTNGTSTIQIQVGYSGGVENTGYASSGGYIQNSTTYAGVANATSGFILSTAANAAHLSSGVLQLVNISGNSWCISGSLTAQASTPVITFAAGSKTLSGGTLDRVRITTVNGTDTFDAGSINILYE